MKRTTKAQRVAVAELMEAAKWWEWYIDDNQNGYDHVVEMDNTIDALTKVGESFGLRIIASVEEEPPFLAPTP